MSSARAIRDSLDLDGFEEPWLVTAGLGQQKKATSANQISPAGVLIIILATVAVMLLPSDKGPSTPPVAYTPPATTLMEKLQKSIPGGSSFRIKEDFRLGLRDWIGASAGSEGWTRHASYVQPGSLRLWKPTLTLRDYQFEFEGQIERKAMGWAFRASDLHNYYASKITITSSGPSPRAEIVRFITLDGREQDRVQLPLPLTVQPDTLYQVRVKVKGNRFSTMVNGQVVDTWSDRRLSSGGVGLFAEAGEVASVRWVRISEGGGWLDRLLSFSLFIGPGDLLTIAP